MPVARFQMPDGRVARYEVPEGTTPEQAHAMISQEIAKPAQLETKAKESEIAGGEKGFVGRLADDFSGRAKNISDMASRQSSGGALSTINNIPTMAALTAGQVAGGVSDIAKEGIVSAYRGVVPQAAREGISKGMSYLAGTAPGKVAVNALQSGADLYGKGKAAYPDAAMALEGAANVAGLAYGAKGAIESIPAKSPEALAKQYSTVVQKGLEKGVRPTVSGKGTYSKSAAATGRGEGAVTEIINRKSDLILKNEAGDVIEGQLPKNLSQFADAIEQTKRNIYQEYNTMAKDAGLEGIAFNTSPLIKKLDSVAGDLKHNPQVRDYAKTLAKELEELHGQPPEIIEARIADLNKSLKGFYEGRVGQAKAEVDASVAQIMREQLDNDITGSIGPGYQDLKKRYGDLKSIEKYVNHRAVVAARANSKGLADLSDIFTGGEILGGAASLLAGNPAGAKGIISGLAGRYIKGTIKDANSADNVVRKMFEKADKIKNKLSVPGTTNALAQQGAPYVR